MTRLVFDIETNGFLKQMDKVHCIVTYDIDSKDWFSSHGNTLEYGNAKLSEATTLIGHNIKAFDIKAINKIYPGTINPEKIEVIDTLVLSRLLFSNITDLDIKFNKKQKKLGGPMIPGKLIGKHGLEAWGHRLKCHKGDYMKDCLAKGIDPWAEFNTDMLEYCLDDVKLNTKLYRLLIKKSTANKQ